MEIESGFVEWGQINKPSAGRVCYLCLVERGKGLFLAKVADTFTGD